MSSEPLIGVVTHAHDTEAGPGHPLIVEIVLDRPEALNAISTRMAEALATALGEVAGDRRVRAVVLSSSHPTAFCVGADLKERLAFSDEDILAQRPVTRSAYRGVIDLPMPAIAAVDGFALGGGFELALGCDLIVAGADATLGLPEVSVGVIPGGGGTQLLTRRVGWERAAELVLTARRLTAHEALAYGIVTEVTAPGAARDRAMALARVIAEHSPVAVRAAKAALRTGFALPLDAALEVEDAGWRHAATSADRAEGISAFVHKRRARWPGP